MPARTQSQRDIVTIGTMIRNINTANLYYILIEAFMKQCLVNMLSTRKIDKFLEEILILGQLVFTKTMANVN